MEILKSDKYISEKLNIKPVSKERLADFSKEPIVDEKVAKFIEEYELKWNPSTRSYDCVGDITVNKDIVSKGKLIIKFGHVIGGFNCEGLHLTSLEGAPYKVDGNFNCSWNQIETLKYAPKEVGGSFDCSCNKLTTLEGAPQKVGGDFECGANLLVSLKGFNQEEIKGKFDCSNNNKLESLEYAPKRVIGDFRCDYCQISSLANAPQYVGCDFICGNNPYLESLKGSLQKVGGFFSCNGNISLESIDCELEEVKGNFRCKHCPNLVLPNEKPSWLKGEIISK